MVTDRQIHGMGTSEEDWFACEALNSLPTAALGELIPVDSRLVICAPHPDDEILPCAGLVAAAHDLGRAVMIIAVTDGEGSHGPFSTMSPARLRKIRPRETREALRRLEVPADVQRLGLPDGGLAEHGGLLELEFSRRFRSSDVVVAPWRLDGHPDHEATTQAARAAVARVGCGLLETPIWGWHWSRPDETPMPWRSGVCFVPTAAQLARKRAAIHAFESQLVSVDDALPILTASTCARFTRDREIYFR